MTMAVVRARLYVARARAAPRRYSGVYRYIRRIGTVVGYGDNLTRDRAAHADGRS